MGDTYERTETDNEIDQLTNGIDILDAYAKWCGKMVPKVGKKTESIMISCPMPDHRDRTPSAWINTDKQTWYCGTCNFGGDKYDIAAFHYGIDDYKTGKNFPDLKRRIAEDEGYVIKRTMTGVEYIEPIREESDSTLPALAGAEPAEHFGANPDKSEPDDDDDEDDDDEQDTGPLGLDLNRLTPMDSKFLRPLMDIACTDDAPWEFYFWQGLQLLGLAVGRDTVLDDRHPVTGNLFLCLTSDTGNRKSTTINAIRKLVREAFPYDQKDPVNEGVKIIGEPGSAEHLIDAFNKPVYDPDDEKEKEVLRFAPVRGLVEYSEFSMLTSRGSRSGSALKPTLHSFYDCEDEVSTGSRAHGDTIAHEPFAAVITTVQPKVLRELLTRDDALSGFLNRWIFVYGTTKPVVPYGGKRLRLDRCVDPLRGIRAWGAMHKVRYPDGLRLSPEAADIYRGFYVDTIEPAKEADNSSLLTRIDLTMKKLALLFAHDSPGPGDSGFSSPLKGVTT